MCSIFLAHAKYSLYLLMSQGSTHLLTHPLTHTHLHSLYPQLYIVMGTHETGAFIHVADKPGNRSSNVILSVH